MLLLVLRRVALTLAVVVIPWSVLHHLILGDSRVVVVGGSPPVGRGALSAQGVGSGDADTIALWGAILLASDDCLEWLNICLCNCRWVNHSSSLSSLFFIVINDAGPLGGKSHKLAILPIKASVNSMLEVGWLRYLNGWLLFLFAKHFHYFTS